MGKTSSDVAKDIIIEQSLFDYLKTSFDYLLLDQSRSTAEELSEVFKDMNGWKNEFFVLEKHNLLEALLFIPGWFDIRIKFLDYYNQFLDEQWHHHHEAIVTLLSSIKSNTSIKYIDIAIHSHFKYLHLDDLTYASFIRKCMWTLADINSPESIEFLHKYINDDNEVIRKYADEQIRWLNGEKGMRYMS